MMRNVSHSVCQVLASFLAVMDREGRGIEYHMTKVLFLFAGVLYLPGDTLDWASYAALTSYGVSEMLLAGAVLMIATIRALALYINGYHHRTPLLRATTSLVSCLLFGSLGYIVWSEYFAGLLARPAVTMAFYPAFVIAELRAASRLSWERAYATY